MLKISLTFSFGIKSVFKGLQMLLKFTEVHRRGGGGWRSAAPGPWLKKMSLACL